MSGRRGSTPGGRDPWFWVVTLLATAGGAALRIAYVWHARRGEPVLGDAFYYHAGANLLVGGRGFVQPFSWVEHGELVTAVDHPPLYLLWLAAWSWFGATGIDDHLVASALLGAASIPVTALAAREMDGARTGALAGVAIALYPNVWRHDGMLMSETMAILTVSLTLWLAYRYWHRPTPGRIALVGAGVALAALSRSELSLLAVLLVVPLVLLAPGRGRVDRLRDLVVSGAACLAVLAPWLAFTTATLGQPVISGQFETTFATANCASTYWGRWRGYWDLDCARQVLRREGIDDPTEPRAREALWDESRSFVGEHLDEVPGVILARWGRLTGLYQREQQVQIDVFPEGTTPWVARLGMTTFGWMAPLGLAGLVVLRFRRIPVFPLLAPLAVVLLTTGLLYATTRFRAPAEPVLCIGAAATLDGLVRAGQTWLHRARWRRGRTGGPETAGPTGALGPDDEAVAPAAGPTVQPGASGQR